MLLLAAVSSWAQSPEQARKHYKLGRKAEKQGRPLEAWRHYAAARAANPGDLDAIRGFEALRVVAAQTIAASGNLEAAEELAPHQDFRADEAVASPSIPERPPPRRITSPAELAPENKRADFAFQGKVVEAYAALAAQFGLRVIFDEDFKGEREIKASLELTDFAHGVALLNDLSGAFIAPITSGLFLVAEDNPNKRQELDPVAAVSIPIPETMTAEETNELVQAVQQTLDIKRSFVSASARQVVLRDNVRKIRLAQELYRRLSQPKGEVMIEVELIAVSADRRVQAGLTLPTAFPVTNFSTIWNNQPPAPSAEEATRLLAIGAVEPCSA
jgi:general secretion pathway protein D